MKTITKQMGLITTIDHISKDNINPEIGYPIGTAVWVYDIDDQNHHQIKIHKDDVDEFVKRIKNARKDLLEEFE